MLTQNRKDILSGKKKVGRDNFDKVRQRARNNAKESMETLRFLAVHYPEAVRDDEIVQIVVEKLKHGKTEFSKQRTKRLPPGMFKRKRGPGKGWVQLAGVLRNNKGSVLKQPEIYQTMRFAYDLLQVIHKGLLPVEMLPERWQVVKLRKSDKKINLSCSVLEVNSKEFYLIDHEAMEKTGDFNTLRFSKGTMRQNYAIVPLEGADPAKIAVIVLEKP